MTHAATAADRFTASAVPRRPAGVALRRAPRARVTYRMRLRYGADEWVGYSVDVSVAGAFVETDRRLSVGDPVHIAFAVGQGGPEDQVEVDGRVVRVAGRGGAGPGGLPGLAIEFGRFSWGRDALQAALDRIFEGVRQPVGQAGRRNNARLTVGLPIYWGHTGKTEEAGFLTNLSASGAFFLEARPTVPPGALLHLWLELPVNGARYPVRVVARVSRVQESSSPGERSGMAIRLENSPFDDALLHGFLDARLDASQIAPPRPVRVAPAVPLSPATAPVGTEDPDAIDVLALEALAALEEAEARVCALAAAARGTVANPDGEALLDATLRIPAAARPQPWTPYVRLTSMALKAGGLTVAALFAAFALLLVATV